MICRFHVALIVTSTNYPVGSSIFLLGSDTVILQSALIGKSHNFEELYNHFKEVYDHFAYLIIRVLGLHSSISRLSSQLFFLVRPQSLEQWSRAPRLH